MKRLLLSLCLSGVTVFATPLFAQTAAQPAVEQSDTALRQRVAAFLDEWHDDATHSRMRYFDKIAPDGIFIGTDKTERWKREDFKRWAAPLFAKPTAWEFHVIKRNIDFSPDKSYIWFDEQLDTQFGTCQASGVIHNTKAGLQIEHYQLSLAVPNPIMDQVQREIKDYESKQASSSGK